VQSLLPKDRGISVYTYSSLFSETQQRKITEVVNQVTHWNQVRKPVPVGAKNASST